MFKRNTDKTDSHKRRLNVAGILNIGMLLVVCSIVFSTYTVYFGTSDYVSKVLLAPQAVFAAWILVQKFSK